MTTTCPEGHPYAGDNLRVKSDGQRVCRICVRAASARQRARPRTITVSQREIVDRLTEAAVAYFPGLTIADVYGKNRRPDAVACRAAVAYTLRTAGWLVVDIGAALARDHSTVLHLVKRHTQGRYRAVTLPDAVAPPLDLAHAIERVLELEMQVRHLAARLDTLERGAVTRRIGRAS